MEELKQKAAEVLKASKSMSSETVLSSGKNISLGVLSEMESTLKVTEVYTCKNKYTIFINKLHFGGSPPTLCFGFQAKLDLEI